MTARSTLAGLLLWALVGGGALLAQQGRPAAPRDTAGAGLAIHHSAARAGELLTLVVEGAEPGADVLLLLLDAFGEGPSGPSGWRALDAEGTALLRSPPSLVRELAVHAVDLPTAPAGTLTSLWRADELGRVAIEVALDDPEDVLRPLVRLRAESALGGAPARSPELLLRVQAPLLVVPSAGAIERFDLLHGTRLEPPILVAPGVPEHDGMVDLRGAALSGDGARAWLLWDGGLLDVLDTAAWRTERRVLLDPASDELASGRAGGLGFVLAREGGSPFAPPAKIMFLEERDGRRGLVTLQLEPMGQAVAGRRWALTDDGLTAFVAGDDLVVREVDLASRELRTPRVVGLPGDTAVADMVVVGRRLYVVTSRSLGRTGTLTVLDLETGLLVGQAGLGVPPERLVVLSARGEVADRLLVVPSEGGLAQLVEDAVPLGTVATDGRWLDAAPSGDGAVLLSQTPDGARAVVRLGPLGEVEPIATTQELPAVTRIVSAGAERAILLGSPDQRVYRLDVASGLVELFDAVVVHPDARFAVLR